MNKKIIIILIFLFIIVASVGIYFYIENKKNIEYFNGITFQLNGENQKEIYIGDNYQEEGFKAVDNNGTDVSNLVTIDNKINYDQAGEYTITYTLNYKGNKKELKRVIKILDDPLKQYDIHLEGDSPYYLLIGNEYQEAGYYLIDKTNNKKVDNIEIKTSNNINNNQVGEYQVTYNIEYLKFKKSFTRKVIVYDFEYVSTLDPKEQTNKNVTIKVTIKDPYNKYYYTLLPNNERKETPNFEFVATTNKKYTFTIFDKSEHSKIINVDVNNIKRVYKCSGTINRNGTKVEVTGDNVDDIKSFTWHLDKKDVEGKKKYTNKLKAYDKISVTLNFDDSTNEKIKCTIKDTLPYRFDYGNDRPLYSTGYCGKISDAENEQLNNLLYQIIDDVGKGTRAGVVEAGRFLMGKIQYTIAYQGTGGNNIFTKGLHFGTKSNSWGCRTNGYINGMDCTGFINWPFYTNDIRVSYANNPQPVEGNIDKIRVGDVLTTYDASRKPYTGIPFGHSELIIGIDDKYIYTLSNGMQRISKADPPSSATNCRNGDCFDNEHHNAYYRNVNYGSDGKLTDMWVE